ncbi:transcriptional regulator [Longispora fulva]|uniref:DNA-binding transcriptional ArsR family regulator n=1 Tax=Longispora fulva TaxID=619741 RepID=A0A8J7GHE2_9ACTN|nr:winged helix-turn-helix domain-containing protein [Longispora fulva]MBG6137560.1 DNA-binding transcriptional ArsR family regulator [Longispora fulva]GIG61086.1 transcriptional regulator [Longispora fulva]
MLRIYFTSEDIARTRLAAAPDPLWELVLSVHMLRGQRGDLLFGDWRRATCDRIRGLTSRPEWRRFMTLTPTMGYFPDFLTPFAAGQGLERGLEAIRRTPATMLDRELRQLAADRRLPGDVGPLARGGADAVVELTDTMRAYHEQAIAPHLPVIRQATERDRALRARAMLDGGVEGLLRSLRPIMEWSRGELRVPGHRPQEIHLGGRGLLLVPSYFCVNQPMTMFDPDLPPVLIYPVSRFSDTVLLPDRAERSALSALIGRTRATLLEVAGAGCSTSELARRAGISVPSASEQAKVLRDAGLLASVRDRNRVVHHVTPLGWAMLDHDHT